MSGSACSGDYDAVQVLRFYAVYRALVRAKVAAIQASQTNADLGQAHELPDACRAAHDAAAGTADHHPRRRRLRARPVPQGVYCWAIQAATTLRLRSDVERKRLFGIAPIAVSGSPTDGGIYASEASELTYRHLYALASQLLAAGWSVIVDAAFLERARRDAFRRLAREAEVAFSIIAPQARPAQLRARVRGRLAKGRNASEATIDVLERQLARIEALGADERQCLLAGLVRQVLKSTVGERLQLFRDRLLAAVVHRFPRLHTRSVEKFYSQTPRHRLRNRHATVLTRKGISESFRQGSCFHDYCLSHTAERDIAQPDGASEHAHRKPLRGLHASHPYGLRTRSPASQQASVWRCQRRKSGSRRRAACRTRHA
jgi:predicted kinase